MSRKLSEIENQIIDSVASDAVLSEKLTNTGKVSIWRLIVFIVSYAIFLHEQIVEKNAENNQSFVGLEEPTMKLLLNGTDSWPSTMGFP